MLTGCGTTQTHTVLVGVLKWYYCCCHSGTKLCPTLRDPINYSIPGFPVLHHLSEFSQVHVHSIGEAIQPSHPLSPSSPSAFNLFSASGSFPVSWLFTSSDQSMGISASASVLPKSIQGWFPLGLTDLISLLSNGPSRVISSTALQFESIISLALSLVYSPALTSVHDYWKDHILDYIDLCQQSDVFAFLTHCLGLS